MSDGEIIKEFLVESYENLDRLDLDLIGLEKEPGNPETLASIFRTIHTIKGTSGFLSFNKLESVTHAGENLLGRLRDGLLTLTPDITTALLAMVDAVRQRLANIEATGTDGEQNDVELIATLTRLQEPEAETTAAGPEFSAQDTDAAMNVGDILVVSGKAKAKEVEEAVEQQRAGDPRRVGEILVEKGAIKPQDVLDALHIQRQARGGASDSTIRVDVGQLDRLMNRVGELVLLRNQIVQFTNSNEDPVLQGTSQRLNLLTTELQESVMKTRMQPIDHVWSKFFRTVRDVAHGCGKQVRMEMEGKETELDKTIIEAIKDPLTHLVRNAVDHGIEAPTARRAAGKDPEGRLLLRAFHEGGQVNIEISDDGAGLDPEKIRNKAMQKGLITADQASRMTERETTQLIFLPGFSTAEKITNVSGRGVGMDIVKTNVEKIGGTVEVQSRPGQGTTFRMKIPLTLAIIPALIVTAAGDRYAIPQVNLLELVRLDGEQARPGIDEVHDAPVYRLRERLLPLVYLTHELHSKTESPGEPRVCAEELDLCRQNINIVVLSADDRQFGLVVDEINDTEEIVVKPLGKQLKSINVYAGATIMGDGKVALILDVMGLAQRAHVVSEVRDEAAVSKEKKVSNGTAERDRCNAVLLFQSGGSGRMAVDLSAVARLEEFPSSSVEMAGAREVVQYRGEIMPLIRVSDLLRDEQLQNELLQDEDRAFESGRTAAQGGSQALHVVVHAEKGRSVGLVVDRILDITEEFFVMQRHTARLGVLGSAVIQKRVTDILDVPGLITAGGLLSPTEP